MLRKNSTQQKPNQSAALDGSVRMTPTSEPEDQRDDPGEAAVFRVNTSPVSSMSRSVPVPIGFGSKKIPQFQW